MSMTVLEATKLNTFENFRLVAGHRGLDRIIEKVGILDWEIPATEGLSEGYFNKGEFVISSLLIAKEKPELVFDYVKSLEHRGVSGLAIKSIYYNELPAEVINYANEKSFPIFIFHTTYFEDIITQITDKIRAKHDYELLETKIDLLIKMNLNTVIVRDVALEINSSFKECFFVIYLREKRFLEEEKTISSIERLRRNNVFSLYDTILKYQNGILIISTFERLGHEDFRKKINYMLGSMDITISDFYVGVSSLHADMHSNLCELGNGINESIFAAKASEVSGTPLLYFNEIGVYSILMPFHNDIWLHNFYNNIITPIIKYDEKYNTELLNTALKYVENDGKIDETANELFLHKNTIRYRINKIKELLNMENCELSFIEQLSIAIKLYKIYYLKNE